MHGFLRCDGLAFGAESHYQTNLTDRTNQTAILNL